MMAERHHRHGLRRTMPARWARTGPLQVDIGPADFGLVAEFGCIGDYAPAGPCVCIINGQFISRRDWWQPVREGDVIVFAAVAHGGGSNPLRLVLQIAIIAAAAYFAPYLTGEFGLLAGFSEAAVTAGLVAAGSYLVNSLLPLPTIGGFGGGAGSAPSPTYSVQFSGNSARLGESIPQRFGQERFYPDYAAAPYNEFDAEDDEYFCAVLCLGGGEFNVLDVQLDDTDLRAFSDVQFAIVGPGQTGRTSSFQTFDALADQALVADNIVTAVEVNGQELVNNRWVGAFSPVRPGLEMDRVFIDLVFPGLGRIQDDGDVDERTIEWSVRVRRIDLNNAPVTAWATLATESLTESTTEAVRRTYGYDLPQPGRYQVSLRRLTARSQNRRVLNDMVWSGLRGRLTQAGVQRSDCTFIVVRARASEQLSGLSQRRINCMAQRLIPRYDSGLEAWDEGPLTVADNFTRNPAEIARYVMHLRGLEDSRIDHATLDELRDLYDERQDRFDYSFDRRVSFDEALQTVAFAGRARAQLRRGAVYTLVRDEPQDMPVALFMPRNMDRDSFAVDFNLPTEETPEAIRFSYRDGSVWADRLVYGQVHNDRVYAYAAAEDGTPLRPFGVPEPSRVQEERLVGIVGLKQALRTAAYTVAAAYYRRTRPSWTTNLEGLIPAYGSLVGLAHDASRWGQSGDVANWDAETLTLTTTEPLTWVPGGTHYVRLQTDAGGASEAILVTAGGEPNEMVLAEEPAAAPVFNRADRERTRYLFGELADVTRYARVEAIRPQAGMTVRMEAVIDDDRVHEADEAWLPGAGELQDPLGDGTQPEDGDVDPYSSNVVAHVRWEEGGAIDYSEYGHAVVTNGDASVTDVDPIVGTHSGITTEDGWFSISKREAFALGTAPWTWEARLVMLAFTSGDEDTLVDLRNSTSQHGAMMLSAAGPSNKRLIYKHGGTEYGDDVGVTLALDTEYLLEINFDGTTLRAFVNGQKQWQQNVAVSMNADRQLRIGRNAEGSRHADAKWGEVRITAGVCRHLEDYTPSESFPIE